MAFPRHQHLARLWLWLKCWPSLRRLYLSSHNNYRNTDIEQDVRVRYPRFPEQLWSSYPSPKIPPHRDQLRGPAKRSSRLPARCPQHGTFNHHAPPDHEMLRGHNRPSSSSPAATLPMNAVWSSSPTTVKALSMQPVTTSLPQWTGS